MFVPYHVSQEQTIKTVNASDLPIYAQASKFIVAIGINPDAKNMKNIESTFTEASIYYYKKAEFYFIDPSTATNLVEGQNLELTAVFLYSDGFLIGSYPYPESESAFFFLLKLFLEPHPAPLTNLTDLYSKIGNSPFTFITPVSKIDSAVSLQYFAAAQMGPIGVVPVVPELMFSLGINSSSMALFRREDMFIVPISMDLNELYEKSYPVYRVLMNSDLKGESTIVFALIAPQLTIEYKDFLFEVGFRHQDFVVGYLPSSLHPYAEQACMRSFDDESLAVVVFNYENGYHYNIDADFPPEFFKRPFNLDLWVKAASRIITQVQFGVLEPAFLSEEEIAPDSPNLQKIVGTTYEKYVMDEQHDVVVLYKRENCPHCVTFFPAFQEFAKECENISTLKFGYIDVTKNSAKKKYPYMPGVPHVHMFPALNKTNDQQLRGGRDRNSLIRMINRYGSYKIPFEAPAPDKSEVAMELFQLLFSAKDMPLEEQMKAMQYMQEVNGILNETSSPTPQKESEPEETARVEEEL